MFTIRHATLADAPTIASHRARMFREMGDVDEKGYKILREKSEARLTEWLTKGENNYIGWLAAPADQPQTIVGGAGVQLQQILPRARDKSTIGEGKGAVIINVFTEPDWRRRGIATLIMKEIIAWSKMEKIDRLLLHASDEGRLVYSKLGFVEGNEMRLPYGD